MLSKLIVTGLGIAASAIILSPVAGADTDDLSNTDVKANSHPMTLVEQFVYCFEHNPYKVHYSTGLSGSSQAALDRINAAKPKTPAPSPAE